MPRLSRLMVRASLMYLVLGFAAGAVVLVHKATPLFPAAWLLLQVHLELVLFGFMLQMAMGVAYWILPRFHSEPRFGKTRAAWTACAALNLGVLWGVVAPVCGAGEFAVWPAKLLELLAAVAFARNAWPRVKRFMEPDGARSRTP